MRRAVPAAIALVFAAAAPADAAALSDTQRVQLAQSALAILGYLPGPIDGIAGPATGAALAAASRDFGWPIPGATLGDRAIAPLGDLAAAELAHRLSVDLDGRWVLDPDDWDEAVARAVGVEIPVRLDRACATATMLSFAIDGLVFTQMGHAQILVLQYGRVVPVPEAGRPAQSEAHGFAPVAPDVLESLTEGDVAHWRRCPG